MNVMVRNMRECMYVSVSGPCGSMSVLHSKKLAFGSPLGAGGGLPPSGGGSWSGRGTMSWEHPLSAVGRGKSPSVY